MSMFSRVARYLAESRAFRRLPEAFETVPSRIAQSRTLGGLDVGVSRIVKYGGTGLGAYALLTAGGAGIHNILSGAELAKKEYDPADPWTMPWTPWQGMYFPNAYNPMYDPRYQRYPPDQQGNADGQSDGKGTGFLTMVGIVLVLVAVFLVVKKR